MAPPIDSPQAIGGHRWKQEAISILATPTSTPSETKRPTLQTDEDDKPEIIAELLAGPGSIQVLVLPEDRPAGAVRRRVPGCGIPPPFAVTALIFTCDKCVANFCESSARSASKAPPAPSRSPADIGRVVPGQPLRSLVAKDRSAAGVRDQTGPGASVAPSCWSVLGPHGHRVRRGWSWTRAALPGANEPQLGRLGGQEHG